MAKIVNFADLKFKKKYLNTDTHKIVHLKIIGHENSMAYLLTQNRHLKILAVRYINIFIINREFCQFFLQNNSIIMGENCGFKNNSQEKSSDFDKKSRILPILSNRVIIGGGG